MQMQNYIIAKFKFNQDEFFLAKPVLVDDEKNDLFLKHEYELWTTQLWPELKTYCSNVELVYEPLNNYQNTLTIKNFSSITIPWVEHDNILYFAPKNGKLIRKQLDLFFYKLQLAKLTTHKYQFSCQLKAKTIYFKSRKELFSLGKTSFPFIALNALFNGHEINLYLDPTLYQSILKDIILIPNLDKTNTLNTFYLNWLVNYINQYLSFKTEKLLITKRARLVHNIKHNCILMDSYLNNKKIGFVLIDTNLNLAIQKNQSKRLSTPSKSLCKNAKINYSLTIGNLKLNNTQLNELSSGDVVMLNTDIDGYLNKLNLLIGTQLFNGSLITMNGKLQFKLNINFNKGNVC